MSRTPLGDNLTVRRAGFIIAGLTLLVAIIGGILMRVFDEHDFPTVWSGLWFAVQTVTTVGYGDHVPSSGEGRAIAVIVMIAGIGFLSVITATISAAFIESARRRRTGADQITLHEIDQRLRRIEESLAARKD